MLFVLLKMFFGTVNTAFDCFGDHSAIKLYFGPGPISLTSLNLFCRSTCDVFLIR